MKTICLCSWKGGTGKTTLTAAAIQTLSRQGYKILIIDLDSNLSMSRIFNKTCQPHNSINLMNGDKTAGYFTKVSNVDIIPSDLRISRMTNVSDRVLKVQLKKLDLSCYDYVFIDPPGTMNALTRNAICASDKIIIPAMPSTIDFEAVSLIFEEMEMMGVESDVQVVMNGFDTKRNVNDIYNKFSSEYNEFFYKKPIPAMKSLKNLSANIHSYSLQGRAKEIIARFVEEVVR